MALRSHPIILLCPVAWLGDAELLLYVPFIQLTKRSALAGRRQVVWGALMAQLADAYVDVAIASQKAEASAATGDADEIVEAQMALRRVKEAVRRARHGLRGASRAQQLRLSEPEVRGHGFRV